MPRRQEYYIGFKIAGVLHRTWNSYATDSVKTGKALAKLPGIEGVLVQGFDDKEPRFQSGDTDGIV